MLSDEFHFDVNLPVAKNVTKRNMLSIVSSVFDPLGFVNPVVVLGRLLFQESVRLKCGWDDVVPVNLQQKWQRWTEGLHKLSDFRVPRCVKPTAFNDGVVQLHHFCDASMTAYGFCTYVRCINKSGEISIKLLTSKCRIAPLKPMTIPRLELQAALLAARADKLMSEVLNIPVIQSRYWSDSEIVLKYIKNDNLRFHVFVGNCVTEIRQLTQPSQWSHIAVLMM